MVFFRNAGFGVCELVFNAERRCFNISRIRYARTFAAFNNSRSSA